VQLYLPIADIPVNVFLILAMGAAVGFVSGMFGIGGGFLMTPLLIFVGIAPAVAVASVASHIAASSFSGALSYWRRRAIDPILAAVLLSGGTIGTALGVATFTLLRSLGQLDLMIATSYVVLLTTVGGLMFWEGLRALLRARHGGAATTKRPGSHGWIHGLPLKMRFKRSKIYLSVIPVVVIGLVIGFIGAVMGIGGGFILVPLLIYVLRVPTSTVIGTSMVLTLVTMVFATMLHAVTNHLVDAVLALILMVGGVTGAQFGARAGQKIRGEHLRLLLRPLGSRRRHPFCRRTGDPARGSLYRARNGGHRMTARLTRFLAGLALGFALAVAPAQAERLIVSVSNHRVTVTPNYSGEELVLFGSVEKDATTPANRTYDLVVTVAGPRADMVTRRKERRFGIWINTDSRQFLKVPTYLALFSNRPFDAIASPEVQRRQQLGLNNVLLTQRVGPDYADVVPDDAFRSAFVRLRKQHGLYREETSAVTFLTPTLFRTSIPLPAEVPIGTYNVEIKLFADGALVAKTDTAFEIVKVGFEQFVANTARQNGFVYGLATAFMALMTGWMASIVFRKD
jgi:uncharacterized protein (TIGR02186 family)